jgi:hypothetical protein
MMGIRAYKELPCARGDSATYFVAVELGIKYRGKTLSNNLLTYS